MKSSLFTLALFMLLVQLASGNWSVKKCANKLGTCRKTCRQGELPRDITTNKCPKTKFCCVLSFKNVPGICGNGPDTNAADEDRSKPSTFPGDSEFTMPPEDDSTTNKVTLPKSGTTKAKKTGVTTKVVSRSS
ncbi:beta-defensin 22-like [Erinaceus europaeus]|uniref:Beta-defensin 22-like n=1 Tax=Erinaceus europaeus TaxID=9365 RepID=A0ABM3Y9M2_ERIEU|nr:beta-defensin 22-like [Erinaceus europaeus]